MHIIWYKDEPVVEVAFNLDLCPPMVWSLSRHHEAEQNTRLTWCYWKMICLSNTTTYILSTCGSGYTLKSVRARLLCLLLAILLSRLSDELWYAVHFPSFPTEIPWALLAVYGYYTTWPSLLYRFVMRGMTVVSSEMQTTIKGRFQGYTGTNYIHKPMYSASLPYW